jgi:hypothetical protein
MKNTISIETINKLFEYKNGFLYRKITRNSHAFAGEIAGTLHKNGYRYVSIDKKNYLEHRLIFALHYGFYPDTVDHIDLNKSNNLIENLRQATHQQNCYNRPIRKDNKSGSAGICWNNQYKKWVVRITTNGKRLYLGKFINLDEAKKVVKTAKLNFHGEFANV